MSEENITIITPTWNRAGYLPKLIDSLKSQTYKNFIWLVGNDGSTDNTDEIIRDAAKNDNIKINYFYSNVRIGKSKIDNLLLENIETDLVTWCDSDDYLLPDALENLVNLISNIKPEDEESFVGVYGQNLDTNSVSQSYYNPEKIPYKKIINYDGWDDTVKGDGTILAFSKKFKQKKFLEVDFLITESSLLKKIFRNKKFLLSNKIVKIMDRGAENSLSFSKKLMHCKGSAFCIMEIENEEVFTKKNLFNRLKIIINYWRYCFHGEIPFFEAKKKWLITKNNNFLIIFFIFSFFLILKDICLNKVVKTHQEFNKNILKAKINSEKFF